jgi:hypothetical protein
LNEPTEVIKRARAATDDRYQTATKLCEDVAQLRVEIGELMSMPAALLDDLATLSHDLATANEPAAVPASPSPGPLDAEPKAAQEAAESRRRLFPRRQRT